MAEETGKIVDLTKTVVLYAPDGVKHHAYNEKTTVSELQAEKFEAKGYSRKPQPKKSDSGKE